MRALVFDTTLHLDNIPVPEPEEGEALVRVLMAGICNTDLEIAKGYMGFSGVLGHEFVGVVEQCENEHLRGKRVVGEINCACGECAMCEAEMGRHCPNRTVLGILGRDGAFAEYLVLPEDNLHLLPASLGNDVAVFTEPTAAAFRILEQIEIQSSDKVIVLGDGKLGQLIAQVMSQASDDVLCVGRHADKLRLLERVRIATAHVDDELEGDADVVIDATGSPYGLERALQLVQPEGAIVLKTTVADRTPCNMSIPVINEVTIIGSRCGPFRPALEALSLGNIEVRSMISAVYNLEDGVAAFRRAAEPGIMKVLLQMSS